MNIVITGGNGFLGSKLAERFILKGHNVLCLDINPKSFKYRKNILKKTKFIKADITSQKSLKKIKVRKILFYCIVLANPQQRYHLKILKKIVKKI